MWKQACPGTNTDPTVYISGTRLELQQHVEVLVSIFDSTKILEIARSCEAAAHNELLCLQVYPDYFGAHTQIFAKHVSKPETGELKCNVPQLHLASDIFNVVVTPGRCGCESV